MLLQHKNSDMSQQSGQAKVGNLEKAMAPHSSTWFWPYKILSRKTSWGSLSSLNTLRSPAIHVTSTLQPVLAATHKTLSLLFSQGRPR